MTFEIEWYFCVEGWCDTLGLGRGWYKKARGSKCLEICIFRLLDPFAGSRTKAERLGEMIVEKIEWYFTSAKLDTYSLFVIRNTVVVIHAKHSIDKSVWFFFLECIQRRFIFDSKPPKNLYNDCNVRRWRSSWRIPRRFHRATVATTKCPLIAIYVIDVKQDKSI